MSQLIIRVGWGGGGHSIRANSVLGQISSQQGPNILTERVHFWSGNKSIWLLDRDELIGTIQ